MLPVHARLVASVDGIMNKNKKLRRMRFRRRRGVHKWAIKTAMLATTLTRFMVKYKPTTPSRSRGFGGVLAIVRKDGECQGGDVQTEINVGDNQGRLHLELI